jgi:coenzyme PQQ precursor peptide PqqA
MPWIEPDFVEISLCMEVTAYVNTDESVISGPLLVAGEERTAISHTGDGGPHTSLTQELCVQV